MDGGLAGGRKCPLRPFARRGRGDKRAALSSAGLREDEEGAASRLAAASREE